MRIKIIEAFGNSILIDVNVNDKISDVKEKYGFVGKQFIYDAEVLEDDMTIGDYGIKEEAKIVVKVVGPDRGGEVGAMAKGLADPTKKGPTRFSTTTEGPDYLSVGNGINLFGICRNKNKDINGTCIAYNKEVCSNFGFGTFNLIKDLEPDNEKCPKCPKCEFPLLKLETGGFMNCNYSYIGTKIDNNNKIMPVNYSNWISEPNKLDYFQIGKNGEYKNIWIKLEITAKPL